MNEPIDTEQLADGTWVGRLSLDGIELECFAETDAAVQNAVVDALLVALRSMPTADGDSWSERNTTLMPADYVPECFVETPNAEPIAEVV